MNAELSTFEQHESSARSYCRDFPVVFARAKGSHFYDENGRGFIDFLCGAGALNYGHNNEHAKQAVMAYMRDDNIMMSLDPVSYTHLDVYKRQRERSPPAMHPPCRRCIRKCCSMSRRKQGPPARIPTPPPLRACARNSVISTGSCSKRMRRGTSCSPSARSVATTTANLS